MKLLIVTQVIDTEHPILGFFHRWVEEFAKHSEHVHVICLEAGKHSLPANVTVHSLGKEHHQTGGPALKRSEATGKAGPRVFSNLTTKLRYTYRFYKLTWSLRKEYDHVFVHMNQIYVILGTPLWKLINKKLGLWYAHGTVSSSLRIATLFADKIFSSTKEGFRIKTSKLHIVGQGIDTNLFKPKEQERSSELKLITVGRISQSKNIETLIKACGILKKKNIDFNFKIIGPTLTQADIEYQENLHKLVADLGIAESIEWTGSVSQAELPLFLQNADVFIHDGSTNSLDKTLIEASLCGCAVVSSNPAYKAVTESLADKYIFKPNASEALAEIIASLSLTADDDGKKVSSYFLADYSISNLISAIVGKLKSNTLTDNK